MSRAGRIGFDEDLEAPKVLSEELRKCEIGPRRVILCGIGGGVSGLQYATESSGGHAAAIDQRSPAC